MLPVSKAPQVDHGQRAEEGKGVEAERVDVRNQTITDSALLTME